MRARAVVVVVVVIGVAVGGVGIVRALDRSGSGRCHEDPRMEGSDYPTHDAGPVAEIARARDDAVRLVQQDWLLPAVPAAAGPTPEQRKARIEERRAALTADAVGRIVVPARVPERLRQVTLALNAASATGGDGLMLDGGIDVREWGPMAVDGDRASACFVAEYRLRRAPATGVVAPVGPDGFARWTQLTYVRLARTPGGPWRLHESFGPAEG